MVADYRLKEKGLGPVVPGAVQRLCTGYMKRKVQERFRRSKCAGDVNTNYIGLRVDEPNRVHRLSAINSSLATYEAPLYSAQIDKQMVLSFWAEQSFDLEIAEHLGNCNKCYLKSEAKLATSMYDEPWDVQWWLDLQDRFGDFRVKKVGPTKSTSSGDDEADDSPQLNLFGSLPTPVVTETHLPQWRGTSMRQIWAEAPTRIEVIRPALRCGREPVKPDGFDPRRWKLLVAQERRYIAGIDDSLPCNCERSLKASQEDDQSLLFEV